MNNDQYNEISSTSADTTRPPSSSSQLLASGLPQPPRESCSRDIVYKGRLTKIVDIVYTDLFLDVSNYQRDKTMFVERVLDERFFGPRVVTADADAANQSTAANTTVVVVVVCSGALYRYIRGAERDRNGNSDESGKTSAGNEVDVYFCDPTMAEAPDRIDRLVTFNVDPFEVCASEGNKYFAEDTSRLKRTFKHAMSTAAATEDSDTRRRSTPVSVRLVFNVFSLNERAIETFSAANNVTVRVSDAHFVLIDDNTDRTAGLDLVCNYCSDLMLCLNDDMRSFAVDGEMPSSVDSALISDPLNFIKLQTRADRLRSSPQVEYFRFKQFYHTFVYGKQNKWGVEMVRKSQTGDGGDDDDDDKANGDPSRYFDFLNDAMHAELTRLYKILRKIAAHDAYERLKRRRSRYSDAADPLVRFQHYDWSRPDDEVDAEEVQKARDKLLKAYSACPLLTSGVDVRSITAPLDGGGGASLKRDHRQLVASLIAVGKPPDRRERVGKYDGMYAPMFSRYQYDTLTFPHGGDLCDTNVLNALLADEVAVSSCMVVQNRLAEPSNSRLSYNRFLDDILFADNGVDRSGAGDK